MWHLMAAGAARSGSVPASETRLRGAASESSAESGPSRVRPLGHDGRRASSLLGTTESASEHLGPCHCRGYDGRRFGIGCPSA